MTDYPGSKGIGGRRSSDLTLDEQEYLDSAQVHPVRRDDPDRGDGHCSDVTSPFDGKKGMRSDNNRPSVDG